MAAVTGGPARSAPDLAVVVMGAGDEPGLVEAVRSVLCQRPAAEVVVVSSGGGSAAERIRAAGLGVPVVERAQRLTPGATRNLGVDATRAPYVAFLAGDCLAEPGWVAGRVLAHRAGATAVGSLMSNAYPHSRSAAAAALLLHHRRMAHTPPQLRLQLGCSYERELIERLGGFREDLRTGEDSELKWRVHQAGLPIVVDERVVTAHRYPTGPVALGREQFWRGVRQSRARRALGMPRHRRGLALGVLADAAGAYRGTACCRDGQARRGLRHGWPLMGPGAVAYAVGAALAERGTGGRG